MHGPRRQELKAQAAIASTGYGWCILGMRSNAPHLGERWNKNPAKLVLCSTDLINPMGMTSRLMCAGGKKVALVFGREESGLTEGELSLCSHACAIPTGSLQPSLNLSHAICVVLSQLWDLSQDPAADANVAIVRSASLPTPDTGTPISASACENLPSALMSNALRRI